MSVAAIINQRLVALNDLSTSLPVAGLGAEDQLLVSWLSGGWLLWGVPAASPPLYYKYTPNPICYLPRENYLNYFQGVPDGLCLVVLTYQAATAQVSRGIALASISLALPFQFIDDPQQQSMRLANTPAGHEALDFPQGDMDADPIEGGPVVFVHLFPFGCHLALMCVLIWLSWVVSLISL